MLRYVTAGESHGQMLTAILEGMPSHVLVTTDDLRAALARRRLGYGRGARMGIEQDDVTITAGIRHGETLGSPIAIQIGNTEWPKWSEVMSADLCAPSSDGTDARSEPLTRPRPGHADLPGMQKYDFNDARPILERASARETAARVAIGEVARRFLDQCAGIGIVSHVTSIGGVVSDKEEWPTVEDAPSIDADPVRCFDPHASARMQEEIRAALKDGDTLGGTVDILVYGCPPGLGTHVSSVDRLDARLAGAMMGIQAIKGVEIGDGFRAASLRGSRVHDEMGIADGGIRRYTDHAGGIEGGMSNGSVIHCRIAMKPIATVPHALRTIDVHTHADASAHHQRSDVVAVAAAGVVAEAMAALVIAQAVLEKFGGDAVADVREAIAAYHERLSAAGLDIVP